MLSYLPSRRIVLAVFVSLLFASPLAGCGGDSGTPPKDDGGTPDGGTPDGGTPDGGMIAGNLVFVSSATYAPNLGGLAPYDQACNALADAAGLQDPGSDEFVAWMSTTGMAAADRVGAARGFVRVDGVPVANDLTTNAIFNNISVDENGAEVDPNATALTGTMADGQLSASPDPFDCAGWTSNSSPDQVTVGAAYAGPYAWTSGAGTVCNTEGHLYCVQTTETTSVAPVQTDGKKIFLTNGAFTIGGAMTPDQACEASKPADVTGAVKAFLATSTTAAADVIDPSTVYVRPDGQRVGTGAELTATTSGGKPEAPSSGIWQRGDDTYLDGGVIDAWTGAPTPNDLGTDTCGDWTVTGAMGVAGYASRLGDGRWWDFASRNCDRQAYLYCVEQ